MGYSNVDPATCSTKTGWVGPLSIIYKRSLPPPGMGGMVGIANLIINVAVLFTKHNKTITQDRRHKTEV